MSKTPHVVDGEASESDSEHSEIEIGRSPDLNLSPNSETFVVTGEAPESDDESKIRSRSLSELDAPLHPAMRPPASPSKIYTSLLHQKLWECNVSLRASIEGLFKHTTDISVEKLTRADKTLLNVQDLNLSPNSETFVVTGEAPESDDESKIRSRSLSELDAPLHPAMRPPASPSKIYTSLLHQKLWECNVSLRASIEGLFKHTTDISVEKLTRADKTLLNVQECMRATNANFTLARARLKQIEAELEKANCSTALPTVKIKT